MAIFLTGLQQHWSRVHSRQRWTWSAKTVRTKGPCTRTSKSWVPRQSKCHLLFPRKNTSSCDESYLETKWNHFCLLLSSLCFTLWFLLQVSVEGSRLCHGTQLVGERRLGTREPLWNGLLHAIARQWCLFRELRCWDFECILVFFFLCSLNCFIKVCSTNQAQTMSSELFALWEKLAQRECRGQQGDLLEILPWTNKLPGKALSIRSAPACARRGW